MLMKCDESGEPDGKTMAFLQSKFDRPKLDEYLIQDPTAKLTADGAPQWLIDLLGEYPIWLKKQTEALADGPVYLALDGPMVFGSFAGIIEWILDGAIASFEDHAMKDWLVKAKNAIPGAFREDKPIDGMALFGFNLKALLGPKDQSSDSKPTDQ